MSTEPILLMSPGKVLHRLGSARLTSLLPEGSVIFTSHDIDVERGQIADLKVFENYASNDEIPLLASVAIDQFCLDKIVILAEADILRAAELRRRHGIDGLQNSCGGTSSRYDSDGTCGSYRRSGVPVCS